MLKLRKIAVTGSLCSGKSEVCRIFKEQGAHVISADTIAHQLLSNNQEVIEYLGPEVNRAKIADIVFSDREKLETLEKILHPKIFQEIKNAYNRCNNSFFVVEVPLLFEAGWEGFFDAVIFVKADKKVRKDRFSLRTNMDFFEPREARFQDEELKIQKADYILENNGSKKDLEIQVLKLIKEFKHEEL